jgi:tetratricopeptide (TPR) repeat protein
MGQPGEARDLNDRGLLAGKRGDQAEAEKLYREAMVKWRALGPEFQPHLGITEYNLSQALCAQGRRKEARPVLEEALALLRGSLGVRHLNTLSVMNYLGTLRLMLGDADGAEALFREALPIERDLYPKDEQLMLSLGGLSSILIRQRRLDEALPMAEESLALALATSGEISLQAALAYANVAAVHKWAQRYDRALPLYRKSLSIYERLVGPEHPRTASILGEIGLIEMEDHNYTLAERDMLRSLDIAQRSPGWAFEEWVGESNLGTLRFHEGKYDDAARRLTRSIKLQEDAGVHGGSDMVLTLETLAKVREKQRRYDDARQLRDRAVTMSSFH